MLWRVLAVTAYLLLTLASPGIWVERVTQVQAYLPLIPNWCRGVGLLGWLLGIVYAGPTADILLLGSAAIGRDPT